MRTVRLLSAALALALLFGCAPKWEAGDNVVSPDGSLAFYNGVNIRFPGQMQVISEKAGQQIDGKTALVSVYMLSRDSEFGYMAMQVTVENGFADILKSEVSEAEFAAFAQTFTRSMLERAQEINPALPLVGPTMAMQDVESTEGNRYRVADLKYILAGNGQNFSILIKIVITEHDLIAIMAIGDNNRPDGLEEEVFRAVEYQ